MAIEDTTSLEYGYSSDGMKALDESLNQLMYEDIKKQLDELQTTVTAALDTCWQGNSHDRFIKDFGEEIERVKSEIGNEYGDLQHRMNDLANYYYIQDNVLYGQDE